MTLIKTQIVVFTLIIALTFISKAQAQVFKVDAKICHEDIQGNLQSATNNAHLSTVKYDPNHPNTVIFSGRVTGHFLKVLEELPPQITRIALENPQGGDAYSSIMIAQKIHEMGLDSYVGLSVCHSACTIIYQGGHQRLADPRALFSYHGPSGTGGDNESACGAELRSTAIDMVTSYGFVIDYVDVFKSNNVLSFVSGQSLLEYGIVHEFKSLNVGNDQSIRRLQEARHKFCQQYPDHDDC